MYRLFFLVALSFTFTTCNFSSSKIGKEGELLQKELDKIDWSKVDTYPSFEGCDTLEEIAQRKACFFDSMTKELQLRFSQDTLYGKFKDMNEIQILVTVNADSKLELVAYNLPDSLAVQAKLIDSLLVSKKRDFPAIYPATKRGVPVTSQFIVPVVLTRNP
ncbi:hypothetical protein [Myroides pelagicus]|uniref:Uncharacterized protein n=1 Tax=Myroides pelagicus TaxID=270914 RepID=A0A7K1GMC5_9FLAO|nr:hypothetical protein [Myroides pelagicus]MEC4112580.1 hypothetical protein [Myroides pelagicus]MTH29543.1 hypothetical protein [Myroides pelagicus]